MQIVEVFRDIRTLGYTIFSKLLWKNIIGWMVFSRRYRRVLVLLYCLVMYTISICMLSRPAGVKIGYS